VRNPLHGTKGDRRIALVEDTPSNKVVTVRQYLIDQLKGFDVDKLEMLSMVGGDYDETTEHISI